jgi:hypothetical protein
MFKMPAFENRLQTLSSSCFWHKVSSAVLNDIVPVLSAEECHCLNWTKQSNELSAWKHSSGQAKVILISAAAMRGGKLLNITKPESSKNT